MKNALLILTSLIIFGLAPASHGQNYLGNITANPYLPPAPTQPNNTFNNPYGTSANSPRIYDSQGQYRGNLNANPYDPNSVANPYGQYGSQYSPNSINNPYGAGSQYRQDSPTNPYGTGMRVYRP